MKGNDLAKRVHGVQQNIRKSLRAIDKVPTVPAPTVPGLPDVLKTLLAALRQTTTSLALSFKPPITNDAAKAQLDKLDDQLGRIISCVLASSGLVALEWQEGTLAIGSAVDSLLDVLARAAENSATTSEDNPYLLYTGLVWDAIDKLTELSASDGEAAVKRFKVHGEVVKDAWTEFKGSLEDENGPDFGADDEWGDLEEGLMGSSTMSLEERARAQAAKPLFGLHQLLHATIPRYIPLLPPENLAALIDTSSEFLIAFDNAVSAMYPEQNEAEIRESLTKLSEQSLKLVSIFEGSDGQTFFKKWTDRLAKETVLWDDNGLSLAKLSL